MNAPRVTILTAAELTSRMADLRELLAEHCPTCECESAERLRDELDRLVWLEDGGGE